MRIGFIKCQGSGNDFPLIDARGMAEDTDWAGIARALSDRAGPVGGDGILLLVRSADTDAAFGQRMFNPDGSEAETCLNGLRCVARLGFEALGIDRANVSLKTSSAQAERVAPLSAGVVTVRTSVGPVSTRAADVGLQVRQTEIVDAPIAELPSERRFTGVAMPNPHLIAFVSAIDEDELVALGNWCETGPEAIPQRSNVSFVMASDEGLFVRTFERGVGLTDSCGSAMGAATFAAGLTGRARLGEEIVVRNRGGLVRASATAPGDGARVTIAGNATFLYDATVEVADERAFDLVVARRRDDEAAAWARAVGTLAD